MLYNTNKDINYGACKTFQNYFLFEFFSPEGVILNMFYNYYYIAYAHYIDIIYDTSYVLKNEIFTNNYQYRLTKVNNKIMFLLTIILTRNKQGYNKHYYSQSKFKLKVKIINNLIDINK
jgi:hypothetical protein